MLDKYIVFVCTGNTCRSPMAQVLAQEMFRVNNIDIEVVSAGVSTWDNQPASPHAIAVMKEEGLDLSEFYAQQVSPKLIKNAALVLTMTARHLQAIKATSPNCNAFTLMEYAKGITADITDPFGGDIKIYKQTAAEIKQLLTISIEKIREDLCKT